MAEGLGLEVPAPLPRASEAPVPTYPDSPALSILSRPGETGVKGRRVAVLVGNGVDGKSAGKLYASLLKAGAVPRLVGNLLGKVTSVDGDKLDIEFDKAGAKKVYCVEAVDKFTAQHPAVASDFYVDDLAIVVTSGGGSARQPERGEDPPEDCR